MNEKDRFTLIDDTGKESIFYKLITFKSSITNKKYLVYADEEKKVYGSILVDDDENNVRIEKIQDDLDLEEINKAIVQVKNSIKDN